MDDLTWLCSPEAAVAIALAEAVLAEHPADPLAAGTELRRRAPHLSPGEARAALEQAALRHTAAQRHGIDASSLLLTRDGLEQATRPVVAAHRAQALRAAGVRRVLDLTGGIGLDAQACVEAGLIVTALERDPGITALLRHNVPGAEIICADATDLLALPPLLASLEPTDAVFVDPARRAHGGPRDLASGRARPERDPERWSPPWSFVADLPHPRVVVKAAPGFDPPRGWHAQWTSVGRVVVECAVFSWPLFATSRRAVVLSDHGSAALDAVDRALPVEPAVGSWLLEPDPAVLAASAQSSLLQYQPDLAQLDAGSTWLTCDAAPVSSLQHLVRAYRVIEILDGSTKDQRRRLRELGIDRLVVKCRDVRRDPQQVLRELRCAEGGSRTLVLTTHAAAGLSVLVEPVALDPSPSDRAKRQSP